MKTLTDYKEILDYIKENFLNKPVEIEIHGTPHPVVLSQGWLLNAHYTNYFGEMITQTQLENGNLNDSCDLRFKFNTLETWLSCKDLQLDRLIGSEYHFLSDMGNLVEMYLKVNPNSKLSD